MHPHDWNSIAEGLKRTDTHVPARERAAFWSEFRALSRKYPRQDPEFRPAFLPVWVPAVACAAILIVAGLVAAFLRPVPASDKATIRSLDVVASHGGVVIMSDEPSQSTILWIVDMQVRNSGGGI